MKTPALNTLLVTLICSSFVINTCAQKLPGKQEGNLRAPAGVQIDGKLDEWNGQLQAYNKTVKINYTISNDDDAVYFTIQTADPAMIQKIFSNNLTVGISALMDGKKKELSTFNYPALNAKDKRSVASNFKFQAMKAADNNLSEDDSVLNATNRKLATIAKVKPLGLAVVIDNTGKGIRSAALFDTKNAFTYELAIPIALLNQAKITQFHYVVSVNGDGEPNAKITWDGTSATTVGVTNGVPSSQLPFMLKEFYGDYTLATK